MAKLEETNQRLEESFQKMIRISEIIPTCQICNKLRTDEQAWKDFETFLHEDFQVDIEKGICEDCTNELVSELTDTDYNI